MVVTRTVIIEADEVVENVGRNNYVSWVWTISP